MLKKNNLNNIILYPGKVVSFSSLNPRFINKNIMRIGTINDSSSFLHAVLSAYYSPYIKGILGSAPISKINFVENLRLNLSNTLSSKVDLLDNNSPIFYEYLGKGDIAELSQETKEFSLENLKYMLENNIPIDYRLYEFISDQLNKDIYIIDFISENIYEVPFNKNLLYKNRESIVLLKIYTHYELLGIEINNIIQTLFEPSDILLNIFRK